MGWRDVVFAEDPSRAAYEALMSSQTGRTGAAAIEGAMEGVGNLMHAGGIAGRALGAVGTNRAGLGPPVDVSDFALYGRDLETGRTALQYGDLLAGTLEDAGEIAPGGAASKILALAGNLITDPAAAPGLLTGAEAAGALAARLRPPSVQGAAPRMPPRSFQTAAQKAYGDYDYPRPTEPARPVAARSARRPRGGKMAPASGPELPFNPTATQKVKARSGWRPSRAEAMRPTEGPGRLENPSAMQPARIRRPKRRSPQSAGQNRQNRR